VIVPHSESQRYVSRGALKLEAALAAFSANPEGRVCADLGSNVGGFVQCLLLRGAKRVYAIDTGYGALDYTLRKDPQVVVMERTNAMHVTLPEPIDLVTIDVGWTRQRHILPAAMKMLRADGRIITLVKPHYEAPPKWLRRGVLPPEKVQPVVESVRASLNEIGLRLIGEVDSPLPGHAGNQEVLFYLRPLGREG
jgi:23S rRNA (cytidine1920-2'-O)/16S rRNA (cytidine1409-2'-O)-methyltransferase